MSTGRTKPCNANERAGRRRKMEQFADAADIIAEFSDESDELSDAYVTLCVHAGIAAADVICCARLGEHSVGESHTEATGLLAKVDAALAKDLAALLGVKTKSGYTAHSVSRVETKRAERSMRRLVDAARSM